MNTEKESGAIRLMEALNAASEELLERSEKAGRAESGEKKAGIRLFVQKYAKACAACLCLAVLGAAYFGISQMRMGSAGDANTKNAGIEEGYNGAAQMGEMVQEEIGDQEPEQIPDQAQDGGWWESAEPVFAEPEWLDIESLKKVATAADNAEANGPEEVRQEKETVPVEGLVQGNMSTEIPEAGETDTTEGRPAANDVLTGEELAAAVPAGYDLISAEGSLYYEWFDGEHSLWLKLTETELTTDLRFDAEPPVYTVQQEWKELIPSADGSGYLQFALLYENGMLAEYCGALERDEVILLMESLAEIDFP